MRVKAILKPRKGQQKLKNKIVSLSSFDSNGKNTSASTINSKLDHCQQGIESRCNSNFFVCSNEGMQGETMEKQGKSNNFIEVIKERKDIWGNKISLDGKQKISFKTPLKIVHQVENWKDLNITQEEDMVCFSCNIF